MTGCHVCKIDLVREHDKLHATMECLKIDISAIFNEESGEGLFDPRFLMPNMRHISLRLSGIDLCVLQAGNGSER